MEDLTGKQFGHYQIVAPLGEGGMAAVYKAYQPSMERYVAIKVLPRHMATSEEFVNRFRREAKLLAQLQHPHILPVFDYGEAEGYPYIVMPFVQSGTLASILQNKRLNLLEIRRIITQIGEALSAAHARGMIHRDIKPSNVLIDEHGNCLLTDFGLARMTEASTKITSTGAVLGTPAYMSPEQGAGSEIDHRSDIYSLGIILYEMVTGRVPYTAETPVAIVFKHIQDPLPSARKLNPDLPEAVEIVLLKALTKNPDDRYQTAADFVQAIQKAIPITPPEDKVLAQTEKFISPKKEQTRNKWILPAGIFIAICALFALGAFWIGRQFIAQKPAIQPNFTTTVVVTDTPEAINSPAPTDIPSTLTPIATSTVSTSANPLQSLHDVQVVDNDTFDNSLEGKWNVGNGTLKDGILEIPGDGNWDGVSLKRILKEGEGVVIDFSYSNNSLFEMFMESGDWDTNPYRRFGIYVGDNNVEMNEYAGKNDVGGENLTENFTLQPDTIYSMIMAVLPKGEFLVAIWNPSDPSKTIYHQEKKDETWSGLTWSFWIQANDGTIHFDNFQAIKFNGINRLKSFRSIIN